MKKLVTLLFTTIILFKISIAQLQSLKTPQEDIIDLEKLFATAIKSQDTGLTKKFLTDTYFLAIGVQGIPLQIVSREHWLSRLKDYVTESYSIDDIKVNTYGNVAVAILMFTQKATVRGQDRSAQFMLTDIWIWGDKGWLITERHSSRPEIPVAPSPK